MSENNRQEVLNQIIYDLYTCNFFSDSQINSKTGGKVKKPKDSKSTISIAQTILNNTQNYCNDNDCVTGKIQYKGGAEYITPNTYRYTGLNWSDPALSTEENVYDGLNLRYCDYGECFRGEISGSFKEDYASAHVSRFNDTVRLKGSNVTVPTNDYAIFTFTMEADLYNSTRYQTEPYSGKVKVVENNVYDDTLQTLDKYLYPISKSAKTVCSESSDGTYLCDVNYDINVSVITEYNRLLNAEKDQIGTIAFRRKNNGVNTDLIALLNNPEIIVMDEPTVGIDIASKDYILSVIKRLNKEGKTIIYTSHYLEEIEELCNKICIMNKGNIIEFSTLEDITSNKLKDRTFRQYYIDKHRNC